MSEVLFDPNDPDGYYLAHPAIPHDEALGLLRRIARGEVSLTLQRTGQTWETVYSGWMYYAVDGWEVVVFNDCLVFDYIDYMKTPDGREGDYAGFHKKGALSPEEHLEENEPALYEAMVRAFMDVS